MFTIPTTTTTADRSTCRICGAIITEYPDEGNGPYWLDEDLEPCWSPESEAPEPHAPNPY